LYERAWSEGKVLLLDQIMAEDHRQLDMIWQVRQRRPSQHLRLFVALLARRGRPPVAAPCTPRACGTA
jgi:hypothetical protein